MPILDWRNLRKGVLLLGYIEFTGSGSTSLGVLKGNYVHPVDVVGDFT